MKIILDAMGGDHAPEAPVLGAIDAARDFGLEVTLVGRLLCRKRWTSPFL